MDPIAKLVSGRLKAQVDGPHPDPELLAAFAEHALPDADRARLLQHLGACSDCREIVYLALPDSAEEQTTLAVKPNRRRMFALRWGTVAASVAIAGIGIFFVAARHRVLPTPQQKAASALYAPAPTQIAAEKRPAELDELQDRRFMKQTGAETKTRPAAKHMTAKLQAGLTFDQSEQVHLTPPAAGANNFKLDASVGKDKAAASTISGLVNSRSITNAVTLDRPKSANEAVGVSSESVAVAEPKQTTAELQLKKGGAVTNRAESAAKVAYRGDADDLAALALRWTLSGNGEILRSSDAGETWKKVTVASGTVFRALSAAGTHVWAGGSAGVLYHSADSGQTWTRVEPVSDGEKLTADVTHIDFADALNGTVSAASGEVWSTSDGGQSWHCK